MNFKWHRHNLLLFLLYSTRGIPSHCPGSIYFEPLHLPLCILIKQSDSRPSLAPRSGSHCWGYQVIHQPSKSVQGMITDNEFQAWGIFELGIPLVEYKRNSKSSWLCHAFILKFIYKHWWYILGNGIINLLEVSLWCIQCIFTMQSQQ